MTKTVLHVDAPRPKVALDVPELTPAQERVMALLAEKPGQTIRQLARPLGTSHATATYHLAALVRKGLLVREREGREVRHYLGSHGRVPQYLDAVGREPRKRAILVLLANQTARLSLNSVARRLDLPFGFVKRTLVGLDRQGLVRLHVHNLRYMVETLPPLRAHAASVLPQILDPI